MVTLDNDDDDWVRGLGAYGSAHLMAGGSAGKMVYWDDKGNIAIMNTYLANATTDVEATVGVTYEKSSTANSVSDMAGKSIVVGGGGDVWVAGVSGSHSTSVGDGSVISNSVTLYAGPSVSPIGGGAGMSNNVPLLQFNPKKWLENYLGIK